ncbi:MAG TPA: SpoIIE family protein phosphatase [Thermoanaerobaculia bacterium]|nr:SpoIIE family protein phosphatase [Thermoanaerobaculia bacterium]
MNPSRRFTIAVVLTAIAFAAMSALLVFRLQHWNHIGWAGLNFLPQTKSSSKVRVSATPPGTPPVRAGLTSPGTVIVSYPGGPAANAGITSGDVIETIDGVPISDLPRLRELDARRNAGDPVTYRVQRNGTHRDMRVVLASPLRATQMLLSLVMAIVLGLSFAVIGLIVFVRKTDDRRATVFYCMAMVGALSFLGSMAIALDGSNLRGIVTTPEPALLVILGYLLVTFAFAGLTLHLSLVFPHDRPVVRARPYVIRWIYVIPTFAVAVIAAGILPELFGAKRSLVELGGYRYAIPLFALAAVILAVRIVRIGRTEKIGTAFVSRPVETMFAIHAAIAAIALTVAALGSPVIALLIVLLAGVLPALSLVAYPVMTFISLYRSYRDSGVEEKRQVKWPLWGTMIAIGAKVVFSIAGLGIGLLSSIHVLALSKSFGIIQTLEIIPRVLYLLIPISFAVAILKYRLMNIDVIIKKTVAYGILSGAIILIYLILVGGLGTLLVNVAGVRNQTMVIASTLVVALLFVPLRNKLQFLVDRNLFRQKYDYPEALRAISGETLAATDLRSFFVFSAEALQQALQNRSVLMFERREDDLVATAKVGLPDSVLGSTRIDGAAANAVERPLDPRRRALPESAAAVFRRVEAALVLPIRSKGVLHGLVALGPKLSDREFDLEDLEFLSSAVDQIAITVDRVRLQTEEQDFEQARRMQQALLPATVPEIDGVDVSGTWKPARAVGGDYYDLLRLGDTQLAVCIGDVAGKGMPAALLMSGLQAAVRASAAPDVAPSELCARVRRVIVQSLAGGRFITFFYCTIDTAARRIRYCNAGHNPPVLVRADGHAVRLDKGGPVFSRLFSNTPFNGGEEDLCEGDRLVLFTDGVSEARDSAGNDYGEDRLEKVITDNRQSKSRELIATIVDSVSSFSGGRVDDDLTLVAVAVG